MKPAFSLSISLWISAVLIAISVYFISVSKKNIQNSLRLNKKLEVYLKAKSALETVKFYVGTGEFKNYYIKNRLPNLPDKLFLDSTPLETNNTTIILQDTSGLINLMYPNLDIINKLLKNKKIKNRQILVDSLVDWLDKDDLESINGAESLFYISNRYNYTPRNSNFLAFKDEVKNIRGWLFEYGKVCNYFVFVPRGTYNFTTMPKILLKIKYNLPDDAIDQIFELKKNYQTDEIFKIFHNSKEKFDALVDLPYPSKIVNIKIKSAQNNISYTINETIDFENYTLLYKED